MILKIVLVCIIQISLSNTAGLNYNDGDVCLTGYMTDLQSWVTRDGKLTVNGSDAIDLSRIRDVKAVILKKLETSGRKMERDLRYLSLANCQLSQVPPIFQLQGAHRVKLSESIEYITFYGNNFGNFQANRSYESSINATGATEISLGQLHNYPRVSTWSAGLRNVTFKKLRQLDLRACRIEILNGFIFEGMPSLTHLFLGENEISFVEAHAFVGLRSITHLDLSRNLYIEEDNSSKTILFESLDTFTPLNLTSLDLSYTPLTNRHAPMLSRLGISLERLSLCYSVLFRLSPDTFSALPLKYLDISGNPNIISSNVLRGLENSLRVLYAHSTILRSLSFFRNFRKLEILKVSNNEIAHFPKDMMHTLENLQVLDLQRNRISSWLTSTISAVPRLKLLILKYNNLNIVSEHMIEDMSRLKYLSLSKNSMICHCIYREMYEIVFQNEFKLNKTTLTELNYDTELFHTGYVEYNDLIRKRKNLTMPCMKLSDSKQQAECLTGSAVNVTGDFLFLDYEANDYSCLSVSTGRIIPLDKVRTCSQDLRDNRSPNDLIVASRSNLILLLILLLILPIVAFIYIFRRNLRYFLITVRNSAMLSLINEKDGVDNETTIFNYDVFVSYCNEDRTWVLDHLLPHVEIDCNISVCLHERDFQVGLSILENIVSCMDRSRSIMLVISKRFLLSQWCQFEMHLAQHRLLETRREDLILILLEEIPRRLRPNTLHYLMLTKTYMVWPREESDRKEFWKRMKKSLVTQKLKNNIDNDSLA